MKSNIIKTLHADGRSLFTTLHEVFFFDIVLTSITLDFNTGRVKRITRLVEVLPVKFQDEIERQSQLP